MLLFASALTWRLMGGARGRKSQPRKSYYNALHGTNGGHGGMGHCSETLALGFTAGVSGQDRLSKRAETLKLERIAMISRRVEHALSDDTADATPCGTLRQAHHAARGRASQDGLNAILAENA